MAEIIFQGMTHIRRARRFYETISDQAVVPSLDVLPVPTPASRGGSAKTCE